MATRITKVFRVGTGPEDDFTPDEIELLTFKLRDWYVSPECDRQYDDPLGQAQEVVKQCLLGLTKDGKTWKNASNSFAQRIKIKAQYDMDTGKGIPTSSIKSPAAKRFHENQDAVEAAKAATTHQPVPMASVAQHQQDLEQAILDAYPELDTPVHRPNVKRLALLYAQQEVVSTELLTAKASSRKTLLETLATLQKTIESNMKALDIYPDQLRKRMDAQRQGSIGDLVAMVEDDNTFREREKLWALTAALQLWWMSAHPNGKKTGPQLHDFEVWHLTRSRPVHYTCKCGHEAILVEGFTPEELKAFLVDNGVLVEKPIIPHVITEDDLDGLAEFGDSQSPDAGTEVQGSTDEGGEVTGEAVPGDDE